MNSLAPRTIVVLTGAETRMWHSVFSRKLRELHRAQIIERCELTARQAGSASYAVYDAFESLVAKGQVSPAR
jgi:hypothetical protein